MPLVALGREPSCYAIDTIFCITYKTRIHVCLARNTVADYAAPSLGVLGAPPGIIGVSAQPNTFTQDILNEIASYCSTPFVFPLSNPTSKAECTPEQVYTIMYAHAEMHVCWRTRRTHCHHLPPPPFRLLLLLTFFFFFSASASLLLVFSSSMGNVNYRVAP